ncbi:hypothetical protein FB45DRAFT_905802, partial [Roridomyces roridus]
MRCLLLPALACLPSWTLAPTDGPFKTHAISPSPPPHIPPARLIPPTRVRFTYRPPKNHTPHTSVSLFVSWSFFPAVPSFFILLSMPFDLLACFIFFCSFAPRRCGTSFIRFLDVHAWDIRIFI